MGTRNFLSWALALGSVVFLTTAQVAAQPPDGFAQDGQMEAEAPPDVDTQPDVAAEPQPEPEQNTWGAAPVPAPAPTPVAPEPEAPEPEAAAPTTIGLIPVGSFFTRFELRRGYDELGRVMSPRLHADQDAFYYRARFGLQTTPIDVGRGITVTARMVPQSSGVWMLGGLSDAGLGMHEGYLTIDSEALRLEVGRFEMAYGEHLVIGSVGWHQTGRSFDGIRAHIPVGDGGYVDVFGTWVAEGAAFAGGGDPTPFAAGDRIFTGVYAGLGGLISEGMELDVYALGLVVPHTADPSGIGQETNGFVTLGARVKDRIGSIDYRAEGGLQLGSGPGDATVLAFQLDAQVGLSLADDDIRLAVGGLYASGDDPTTADFEGWNQLFPTAHKFLGFSDVMGGRSNVAGPNLLATANIGERLKLRLDGHIFFQPEGLEGYAGSEVDLGVVFVIARGLALRNTYSLFLPSEDAFPVGGVADHDPIHLYELELRYTLP